MTTFVVLTTQRSGATFFLFFLSNHPQIACRHQTVFTQDHRFKFFSFDRPTSFYYQYRSGSLRRQLRHWFRRRQLIYDCLDDYLRTLPDDVKAKGIKISYNHIDKYPAIADWMKEHQVSVVHLIRRNVLKTALSLATAKKRGFHQSTQKAEVVKVRLSPARLKRDLARRNRAIQKYQNMFPDNPYLEIEYESLVANREAEMQRTLQFLGIDEVMPLDTDLVKLNPDALEEIIENYEEVVQALKGTVFEKYLVA